MEERIETKTLEIKCAMSALGKRLETGDESQLLYWVIQGNLACVHRPLRHHPRYGGSGNNLASSATSLLFQWADQIQASGIQSIISLMHDRDLHCYASLNLGTSDLLEFYKKKGFDVVSIPWEDPHHKRTKPNEKRRMLLHVREKALTAYDALTKPVLVQCSAGIDRSSPVAAFIYVKRVQ